MKKTKKDGTAEFMIKLVQLKIEAGNLGLCRTMSALEYPQQIVGWELCELLGDTVNWDKLEKQWKKEFGND